MRNRALLAVAFYAGLRRSEIVSLQWDDLDLEQGLVTVREGKGDKARTIPFASEDALPYIEEWKRRQAEVTLADMSSVGYAIGERASYWLISR